MDPRTFNNGDTISYLKLNGNFTDQVVENNITQSMGGYAFAVDSTFGVDGNAVLYLKNDKNIVINNTFNVDTPVTLTEADEYSSKAFTASFWLNQFENDEKNIGFHPIKVKINVQDEYENDIFITYTNLLNNTYNLKVENASETLIEQSFTANNAITDNWNQIVVSAYTGKLTESGGTIYNGHVVDLFVNGTHIGYGVKEGDNLLKITKIVGYEISPVDTENYITNAAIADIKVVNALEYYPSTESNFVPTEVDNGPVDFVYIGEQESDGSRNIIQNQYSRKTMASLVSSIFTVRGNTGHTDDIIGDIYPNKWRNLNDLADVVYDDGVVSNNAIHFPGNNNQGLVLNGNILYGLTEYTISAWVKSSNSSSMTTTLMEIIPKDLLDYVPNDFENIDQEVKDLINAYKTKINAKKESVNISIYDNEANEYGTNIDFSSIPSYNRGRWNHIAATFKNNIFTLFINGEKVDSNIVGIDQAAMNLFYENMYTVIGASFLDDISDENNANELYIDDFKIFNKSLFTDSFTPPTSPLFADYYSPGIEYDITRDVVYIRPLESNTSREVKYTGILNQELLRYVLNPSKYVIFKFNV